MPSQQVAVETVLNNVATIIFRRAHHHALRLQAKEQLLGAESGLLDTLRHHFYLVAQYAKLPGATDLTTDERIAAATEFWEEGLLGHVLRRDHSVDGGSEEHAAAEEAVAMEAAMEEDAAEVAAAAAGEALQAMAAGEALQAMAQAAPVEEGAAMAEPQPESLGRRRRRTRG